MKLVNFLKKLRNEQVTIELKNGTTIWGTLQSVSPQMNATLTDVRLSVPLNATRSQAAMSSVYLSGNATERSNDGISASLQYINVRGNTIRQIILPDSLNLDSLLVDDYQLNRLRKTGQVTDSTSRKRTRGSDSHMAKRARRGV
ncbi:mRNA splicing protein smd1 [Maudiozyma exigua]|uniref:mRNA splicing protein smd1 n=1 Tax=Maudiozyma exigua TaxID=34358 RepID=A0A9P6WDI4_MAUEX|nr:mRNA splicing protein smd1 [Kazachstania exigua]